VQFSNEIPVKSREVLAVGPQSVPVLETVLITLAHLSVHSEEVEVEVCLCSLSPTVLVKQVMYSTVIKYWNYSLITPPFMIFESWALDYAPLFFLMLLHYKMYHTVYRAGFVAC
jgi:hypothetical protein